MPAVGSLDPFKPQPVSGGVGTNVGTTLSQDMVKASNQGKPGFDILGNPIAPTTPPTGSSSTARVEPTVLYSGNVQDKYQPALQARLAANQNYGYSIGEDNVVRDASGNIVPAPQGTPPDQNGQYSSGGFIYAPPTSVNGTNYDQEAFNRNISLYNQVKSQTDPQTQKILDNITSSYTNLIQQTQDNNKRFEAGLNQSLLMGGTSRYAQGNAEGLIHEQVNSGILKIAQLENQKQQALLQAQQAADENNWKLVGRIMDQADAAKAKADSVAKEISKNLSDHFQKLIDQQTQAAKDNAIGEQLSSGVTDPAAILKNLRAAGNTNINSKDIADTLNNLTPDAKNITELLKTAAGNGASSDILSAIGKAGNYTVALKAAGLYASNASGDLGLYQNYVRTAQAAGQNPVPFESWQSAREYAKAFASAKGTAAGKAVIEGSAGNAGFNPDKITSKSDFPQDLKPYAKQSGNGTWYLDLSSIGAQSRKGLIDKAGDIPVITDKNQAADLVNIKDAYGKLNTIGNAMKDMTSASALSRDLGGAGLTRLASIAQTNPKKAAAEALNDSALDFLKAISGVQGFRGNQTAIEQIRRSLPKITDTQDVAAQKLSFIAQQIADREEATVGGRGTHDVTNFVIRSEDQAKTALINYGKNNPEQRNIITQVMNETNPDTGQPYTYLEAAQILNIDIPAISGDPLASVHYIH